MRRLLLTGSLLVLAVLAVTTLATTTEIEAAATPELVVVDEPVGPPVAVPARPELAGGSSTPACPATAEPATAELQRADLVFPRCGYRCEGSSETYCAGLSCQGSPAFVPCSCDDGRWRCFPC